MELTFAPFYFPALAAMFGSTGDDAIERFDLVRLCQPVMLEDGGTLPTGAHGAVVAVSRGAVASYDVEFPDGTGHTLALLTLTASQIQRA